MRKILLQVHLYAGIIGALLLAVAGLTGSILSVETELDRWLNPKLWYVSQTGQTISVAALTHRAASASHDGTVSAIRIPDSADLAYEFSLSDGRLIYVDPYTGRILGTRRRADMIIVAIHNLHTRLLVGEAGEKLMGFGALLLAILSTTGLILWWPRKLLTVKLNAPWVRVNYELHQVSGFYSAAFLLIFAWTGCVIAFNSVMQPWIYRVTETAPAPPPPPSKVIAGAKQIAIDEALRRAKESAPGAKMALVLLPSAPKAPIWISAKYPEDRTPAGRTRIYIDQFSGQVLRVDDTRQAPLGLRACLEITVPY